MLQLYDNGFRAVHSIDTNSTVVGEQRQRNRQRPELVFLEDDATSVYKILQDLTLLRDIRSHFSPCFR